MPAKMPRSQVYCYALFYVYGRKVKKKKKKTNEMEIHRPPLLTVPAFPIL